MNDCQQDILRSVEHYGQSIVSEDVMRMGFPGSSEFFRQVAEAARFEFAARGGDLPARLEPLTPEGELRAFCEEHGLECVRELKTGHFLFRPLKAPV